MDLGQTIERVDADGRWVTMTQAGELAGCSHSMVARAVRRREIAQRPGPRNRASLDRESVTQWAVERQARLEERAQRRQAKQLRRELGGRPNLEHDWLDVTRAGEMLGVTRAWVAQLAAQDRLPFTVVDGRRWFRRDHLEMWRVARQLERREVE